MPWLSAGTGEQDSTPESTAASSETVPPASVQRMGPFPLGGGEPAGRLDEGRSRHAVFTRHVAAQRGSVSQVLQAMLTRCDDPAPESRSSPPPTGG
jgi:hypothetical protein